MPGAFATNRLLVKLRGRLQESVTGDVVCAAQISAFSMIGDEMHTRGTEEFPTLWDTGSHR